MRQSFRADCNSLILKRRDVRVVEGARLEMALAVCDGVLQISITVAEPESLAARRVTSVDHLKRRQDLAESSGPRHSYATVNGPAPSCSRVVGDAVSRDTTHGRSRSTSF